jgi:pimeloyl-ACP methyl ester carboxylesterase
MTWRCTTAAALLLYLIGLPSSPASDCGNLFGQRCRINLSTGVRMSYFDAGLSSGDAIILLHTDTTSAVEWAWTVDALLQKDPDLHVYALDQRGAGQTELPDTPACWATPNVCLGITDLAADVLAFMDRAGVAKATLVGHALGAAVARNIALEHPERVIRLVLSGTGAPRASAPDDGDSTIDSAAAANAKNPAPPPTIGIPALGWQKMLEAKGVKWPAGALHMRPLDIDPDAVRNISQHWDVSVIARPAVVLTIAAQTATESLASWGVLDPTPFPPRPTEHLDKLSVPALILWGSEDAYLDRRSQERLIQLLRRASQANRGMYFYWKQYGVRSRPSSRDKHDADDIGHNLSWEAPEAVAADIESFVRTGAPTRDRYRTDAPRDVHRILVEPGRALIESSGR